MGRVEFTRILFRNEKMLRLRAHLPELNFITLHYLYFIGVCFIASVIFYGSSKPGFSISYTDSLFLVVSAMTEAGLNTVNLSVMTTFQQVILWLLIIIGSAIWVSIFTVLARKHYFESRFKDIVKRQKDARRTQRRSMSERRSLSDMHDPTLRGRLGDETKVSGPVDDSVFEGRHSEPRDPTSGPVSEGPVAEKSSDPVADGGWRVGSDDSTMAENESLKRTISQGGRNPDPDHIAFMRYANPSRDGPQHSRVLSFAGVGAHPYSTSFKFPPAEGVKTRLPKGNENGHNRDHGEDIQQLQYPQYLTRHTTGRNAQFFGLTRAEREHLGGVEYRAISLLAYVVPTYFVLWQLLGGVGLGAYMAHNKASTAEENGINPW